MICKCNRVDFMAIYEVINDASRAYNGVIPADCWKEPYMSKDELQHEIEEGVIFWGYKENEKLVGVMGIQQVQDVALIRHAYVGTWAAANWAIRFYEKHGFRLVSSKEKDILLRKYWRVSKLQMENSVVLGDERWFDISKEVKD